MPSRNIVKHYAPDAYYHLYNRGVNKDVIFKNEDDYRYFLALLKRYLGSEVKKDKSGRPYKNFNGKLELLSFCLMPNHFHLLVYQTDTRVIEEFSRSFMTSYSMYFNLKYSRVGVLFQSRVKASKVDSDAYLWHISRYIHLNPQELGKDYRTYGFSSYRYMNGRHSADWIYNQKITDLMKDSNVDYAEFVRDYESIHKLKKEISHQLAG